MEVNNFAAVMGDGIRVFIGLERNNTLDLKPLKYFEQNPQSLDDVFSEIIVRDRSTIKPLFNSGFISDFNRIKNEVSVEGLYDYHFYEDAKFDLRFGWDTLKPNILIFFLNSKTQWCIGGNLPDPDNRFVHKPRLLTDVLKGYYQAYYPQAVVEEATRDPKQFKRVIDYSADAEYEHFTMQSLLANDRSTNIVSVALDPA